VKGAAGAVVFAGFFKLHAAIDQLNNIEAIKQGVDKALGYESGHRLLNNRSLNHYCLRAARFPGVSLVAQEVTFLCGKAMQKTALTLSLRGFQGIIFLRL
jgi:hypothetical protein